MEGCERVVELAGGLVVLERVADLAAGQAGRVGLEGGVDLFGEWLAGRALECPVGGVGGVVVQGERGGEVLRVDLLGGVGEGVEEREADRVRFGASGDLTEHAGKGSRKLAVGVMPEFAGVGVQAELPGGLGVLEGRGEQAGEAGAGERVGVAAFGEQALASAGDDQDAVEVAV